MWKEKENGRRGVIRDWGSFKKKEWEESERRRSERKVRGVGVRGKWEEKEWEESERRRSERSRSERRRSERKLRGEGVRGKWEEKESAQEQLERSGWMKVGVRWREKSKRRYYIWQGCRLNKCSGKGVWCRTKRRATKRNHACISSCHYSHY